MNHAVEQGRKHMVKHTKTISYLNRAQPLGSGRVLCRSGLGMYGFMAGCAIRFNMATGNYMSKKEGDFTVRNEITCLQVKFYRMMECRKNAPDAIDRWWCDALGYVAASRLGLLEKPLIKSGTGGRNWKVMEVRRRPGVGYRNVCG